MEILKTLRERAGLTVAQAAGEIGVSRVTIYDWEKGAKAPDPARLRAAMDCYGASDSERAQVAKLRAFGA